MRKQNYPVTVRADSIKRDQGQREKELTLALESHTQQVRQIRKPISESHPHRSPQGIPRILHFIPSGYQRGRKKPEQGAIKAFGHTGCVTLSKSLKPL